MAENIKNKVNGSILPYPEYIQLVEKLVNEGKTTGHKQSEALAGFTSLNLKRMQRIDKTLHLSEKIIESIESIEESQNWWVITEAWCGDSAQNLPIIARIAEESRGSINLNILFRDDNPELMNQYLTNGSKSIPKLIAFDNEGHELFTWGPRPEPAHQLLLEWKTNPNGINWDDFEKELHTWYAKDKAETIQQEFSRLIGLKYNI